MSTLIFLSLYRSFLPILFVNLFSIPSDSLLILFLILYRELQRELFLFKTILSDFFQLHSHFHPDIFLVDSAFDTIEIYGFLKYEFHFSKVLIPYNPRNESTLKKVD